MKQTSSDIVVAKRTPITEPKEDNKTKEINEKPMNSAMVTIPSKRRDRKRR